MSETPSPQSGCADLSLGVSSRPVTLTAATFEKSSPPTLAVSRNAISSRGSAAGPLQLDLLDCLTASPCGPAVVHASHSAQRDSKWGKRTTATYGPSFDALSPSAILQSSLANRLQANLAGRGSPLFGLTWKQWPMQSGAPICALRASARRTFDSDCFGWRSPNTVDANGGDRLGAGQEQLCHQALKAWPTPRTVTGGAESAEQKQERGRTESGGGDLQSAALLASWPTPQARDVKGAPASQETFDKNENARPLNEVARLTAWPTPRAEDAESAGMRHSRGVADTMTAVASLAAWPTPMAGTPPQNGNSGAGNTDSGRITVALASWPTPNTMEGGQSSRSGDRKGEPLIGGLIRGLESNGCNAATARRGQLNPAFTLWLMGFGEEWLFACPENKAIPRQRKRRNTGTAELAHCAELETPSSPSLGPSLS
jgi:hypothetical protein